MDTMDAKLTLQAHSFLARLQQQCPNIVVGEQDRADIERLFLVSEFAARSCLRDPSLLDELMCDRRESIPYYEELTAQLSQVRDEPQLHSMLRRYRHRELTRIAWRELTGADVADSLIQLSALADALIITARDYLYDKLSARYGIPYSERGEVQSLLILAMGKLGGRELNFSSDIDLIFAFAENGYTQSAGKSIDNQQFFSRLAQQLIRALDDVSEDGQVYRVDLRLRPFGDSGPLVASFAALEDYYLRHGRDWERYALIKGRTVGASECDSMMLAELLRPFIYRRYIDFSVIEALRNMKAMINAELRRRDLRDNIKLGSGGIREVEFIVQSFQLIRGGRERALQTPSLLQALEQLQTDKMLPQEQVEQLRQNYFYLRRIENILQLMQDKQTQTLPSDELERARVLSALGESDWPIFSAKLQRCMEAIHQIFLSIAGEGDAGSERADPFWYEIWQGDWDEEVLLEQLSVHLPEPEVHAFAGVLLQLKREYNKRPPSKRARDRLKQLMPQVFAHTVEQSYPSELLQRIVAVFDAVITRPTYLDLLVENRGAFNQLLNLCERSAMVAERLARYPILLDELLNPYLLAHPTPLDQYASEMRQFMLRIDADDEEAQLEGLRQFKQIQQLRIAAADISGNLPLMKVSDHLTSLAQVLLEAVVELAYRQMVQRYGEPVANAGECCEFGIIAYGKLGGWELGYGSDLDLVFVHECAAHQLTEGPKQIESAQFYLKLAQRLLHLITVRSASGILYEVDMRLRPSGQSGMLVSSTDAYQTYQLHDAWIWEHQALVRSRLVYGSARLQNWFENTRRQVLSQTRDGVLLRQEIRQMRCKMLQQHAPRGRFDLKRSVGGIIDIEFMAQYLALGFATVPAQGRWTDTIRILDEAMLAGAIDATMARQLQDAYRTFRELIHHHTLQGCEPDLDDLQPQRAWVNRAWNELIGRDAV